MKVSCFKKNNEGFNIILILNQQDSKEEKLQAL